MTNRLEIVTALCLVLAQMGFSVSPDARLFYGTTIALILFVFSYVGRRVVAKTKPIPIFFSHVGLAMVAALGGAVFHYRGNSFLGVHLYQAGMVLFLVLGIGTRFFSLLSGLPPIFENPPRRWKSWTFHSLGVTVGILLFLSGRGVRMAYLGLALVSLVYLFVVWQVQRPSTRPSALKYGARFVAGIIPLSFFLAWWYPLMVITWLHLLFIGCFGLMTFLVATRVTLAHGSFPLDLEMKSPTLWVMVTLLLGSLALRVAYSFSSPENQLHVLHLAATLWILAVGSWCWSFLKKLLRPNTETNGNSSTPGLPIR